LDEALIRVDEAVRDLFHGLEHGTKRISHAGDYMTPWAVEVAGCR
jgi:hypothetical protein